MKQTCQLADSDTTVYVKLQFVYFVAHCSRKTWLMRRSQHMHFTPNAIALRSKCFRREYLLVDGRAVKLPLS